MFSLIEQTNVSGGPLPSSRSAPEVCSRNRESVYVRVRSCNERGYDGIDLKRIRYQSCHC